MPRLVIPVLTPAAAEVIPELTTGTGAEVVAVAIDVGQPGGLGGLRTAALGAGAVRCHAVDIKEALAERFFWPALRAGALAAGGEPIVTALSMPAVAETLIDICRHEGAPGVAVWCESSGDRQRLRALLKDLGPSLGLVSVRGAPRASATRNSWATVEAQTAGASAPESDAGAGRATLRVGFERGEPRSLNGVPMPPAEIVDSLRTIAEDHGVGPRTAHDLDAPSRAWTVHAPAAFVLERAMSAIAARVLDPRTAEAVATMAERYAGIIRDGAWFTPVREGLDAFMARVLDAATGDVTMHLDSGRIEVDE